MQMLRNKEKKTKPKVSTCKVRPNWAIGWLSKLAKFDLFHNYLLKQITKLHGALAISLVPGRYFISPQKLAISRLLLSRKHSCVLTTRWKEIFLILYKFFRTFRHSVNDILRCIYRWNIWEHKVMRKKNTEL